MSHMDTSLKIYDAIVPLKLQCPDCEGQGLQEYEFGVPDYGGWNGGYLDSEFGDCERCGGLGEIAPIDEAKWEDCQILADNLVTLLEAVANASLSSKQNPSSPEILSEAVKKVEQCVLQIVAETKKLEELK